LVILYILDYLERAKEREREREREERVLFEIVRQRGKCNEIVFRHRV